MRRQADYSHKGFKKVSDYYYKELLSRNPITATWLGEHQYDEILPETGAESIDREIAFYREMKDSFSSIPENELSLDERLDRSIAIHFSTIHLFFEEDLKRWKQGKDLAMQIGDSVFLLFARSFAPLTDRIQAIIARLKSVPMFLMSGKTLFQNVPPLWGEIYLDSAKNLPAFLDTIENSIKAEVPEILVKEFAKVSLEAKKALAAYSNWLKHAIMPSAKGNWALGKGAFQALLNIRKLGLNNAEILDIGNTYLTKASSKLDLLGSKILGVSGKIGIAGRTEVHGKIRNHCPANFDQALLAYKDSVKRSRAFVEVSHFATLPENEELEVVETPNFMSHVIPFAAYIGPERKSKVQKGTYLVTRSSNNLGRNSYADISNCSIHEGYPGHHLQLTGQNLHPSSLRIFSESAELVEGWAHYCEEEIKSYGFESSNENYFMQSYDELFRAARILIDVNIHQQTWSFEKALNFLMESTQMDKSSALAEMKRYTQTPGYQLSHLTGKYLIKKLKNDLKQDFGADFNDKSFHDLIIYEGNVPIYLGKEYYPKMMKENLKRAQK
jgi:uncharacterized protein (DUF885 family)